MAHRDLPPTEGFLVVTGGGKGITARCLSGLAAGSRCLLVGRSPHPSTQPPEPSEIAALPVESSLQALRAAWAGQRDAAGDRLSLATIKARAAESMSRRALIGGLQRLEEAGLEVEYLSLDLCAEDAPARLAAQIEDCATRWGAPSALIHGAGRIEDQLLVEKSLDSFQRVYETKAEAFARLYRQLQSRIPRWVLFSSVAGALGNRGQSDYAAANSALDLFAELIDREGGAACSIQWGPWGGGGMVDEALAAHYQAAGVELLRPDRAVDLFAQAWAGRESGVILYGAGSAWAEEASDPSA